MSFVKLSSKGQITIPVSIRTLLGINPHDKVELVVRKHEVILQPVRDFRELRGSLTPQAGDTRERMQTSVAEHVLEND